MVDFEVVEKLKKRYDFLHPLVFARSVERAKNVSELFEILESAPRTLPIKWNDSQRKWTHCLLVGPPKFRKR